MQEWIKRPNQYTNYPKSQTLKFFRNTTNVTVSKVCRVGVRKLFNFLLLLFFLVDTG